MCGWPGVSINRLGEIAILICNFDLRVAARAIALTHSIPKLFPVFTRDETMPLKKKKNNNNNNKNKNKTKNNETKRHIRNLVRSQRNC